MKAHFNKFIVLLGLVPTFTIGCSRQVKEDNPFAYETVIYTNRGEQINKNPTKTRIFNTLNPYHKHTEKRLIFFLNIPTKIFRKIKNN